MPPVFPIVLYNGNQEWDAPMEMAELFSPTPKVFAKYQIQARYFLLAENTFSDEILRSKDNIAAILFRLENSNSPEQFVTALDGLIQWLERPEQDSLRRTFVIWLKRVLMPRKLAGQKIPDLNNLNEVKSMLTERVDEWTTHWKQEGRLEGKVEGVHLGQATTLRRLMAKKFGVVPRNAEKRIEKVDNETLLEWSENVLTAESIDDVFH